MASSSETLPKRPRSFDPPQEAAWHRMIAEAAYYLAERRGFVGGHSTSDWLTAEQQVRQVISPILDSEVKMNDTATQNLKPAPKTIIEATEQASNASRPGPPSQAKQGDATTQRQEVSRFERFAATQAAGDGIEGDVLKPGKSVDEKLAANMPDRK